MKRNTKEPTTAAAEEKLFDNWFDPIEMTLRGKVRGFLEGLMEEELAAALQRPRHGRRPEDEAGQPLSGHRHGRRRRKLSGTFGETEIDVPTDFAITLHCPRKHGLHSSSASYVY